VRREPCLVQVDEVAKATFENVCGRDRRRKRSSSGCDSSEDRYAARKHQRSVMSAVKSATIAIENGLTLQMPRHSYGKSLLDDMYVPAGGELRTRLIPLSRD
jgi:hypothetical protein